MIRRFIPYALRPSSIAKWRIRHWTGLKIRTGPFAGMQYHATERGCALLPKLLGTYEKEVAPIFPLMRKFQPEVILNVGAAEGYYAVGCIWARIAPKLIAFEMDEWAQGRIRTLQAQNNVPADRIDVHGICTRETLAAQLDGRRAIIIMDVEGHEVFLLDPMRLPALRTAAILVETHDVILPGVTDELAERMKNTHQIETIPCVARTESDLACDDFVFRLLPYRYRMAALSEYRPAGMKWLWLAPKENLPA